MAEALSQFIVQQHDTIEAAMLLIEENRHRAVIVLQGDTVVGTLSDGDIREAILDRRLLNTPVEQVMHTNFVSLSPEQRHRARELFEEDEFFLIPIVDEHGKLVDVEHAY